MIRTACLGLLITFLASCQNTQEKQNVAVSATETKTETVVKTENAQHALFEPLQQYIQSLEQEQKNISEERKKQLKKVALYVRTKKESDEVANLTFICTHNSRRSHISQLWAQIAAYHFGVGDHVKSYSGGTEVTAFNERAVAAMVRAGFQIEKDGFVDEESNPLYKARFSAAGPSLECFSKKYDHSANAQKDFVAVMTCSDADKNCPFIPGASMRIPIPYVDPKESDGSDQESEVYDTRCRQIAAEMFYLMSQV